MKKNQEQKQEQQSAETAKIAMNPGNLEILKVKLLGDISANLLRIAKALEKE